MIVKKQTISTLLSWGKFMYNYLVLYEPDNQRGTRIVFRTNDLKEAQAFCQLEYVTANPQFKQGKLTIYKAKETYQN